MGDCQRNWGSKSIYTLHCQYLAPHMLQQLKVIILGSILICLQLVMVKAESHTIHVGFSEEVLTFDPANHRSRTTDMILGHIYNSLVTRTPRMMSAKSLVETWRQIDHMTYEVTLRQGIRFHNGEEMLAEDVAYSFDRISKKGYMNGQTSPRARLFSSIEKIAVIDQRTFRILLSNVWPHVLSVLPYLHIVDKSFVSANSLAELNSLENGSGPFRMTQWKVGERIVLERFNGYFGGSLDIPPVGTACVERVIFEFIPDNNTRIEALLSGEVDIINDVPVSASEVVRLSENTELIKVDGTRSFFITLNVKSHPFNNLKVRLAANHAVNKKKLIGDHLSGNAEPINGILGPAAFSFNPDLPMIEYDPDKARRLMSEAGFPNGIDVDMDVNFANYDIAKDIAEMFNKVGIRTHLKPSPSYGSIRDQWRASPGSMWLTSWGNSTLDPVGIFTPTLHSLGQGNFSGYYNVAVDQLLDSAAEEKDQRIRQSQYRRAERIVQANAPFVFLWVPQDLYGTSHRVRNFHPSPDGRMYLEDVCNQ